jgi:tRNA pseudouridine55 synthase
VSRERKKKGRAISGWIVLDKPAGIGSTECVARIKRLYQAAKAGHAGTLDPLASGMLPIALGEATRTVPYVMDGQKTYRFTVRWGARTNTDDLEGAVCQTSDLRPERQAILTAMAAYRGEIEQAPPAFSAVKINGERAYKLAREGGEIEIAPRRVNVFRLELTGMPDRDHTSFECDCGKGTYVRALARDIGRDLGCFGHVSELRRVSVGMFDEQDLIPLAELEEMAGDLDALDGEILPTGAALEELTEVAVSGAQAGALRSGNAVLLGGRDAISFAAEAYAVSGDDLVAIGTIDKGSFLPRRVFKRSTA